MSIQHELKKLLTYDPDCGIFTHKITGRKVGTLLKSGYRLIHFKRQQHMAIRLAWLYMTGDWPSRRVNLVNGERDDLRWGNLRISGSEPELTAATLRQIVDYDQNTGEFKYRVCRGRSKPGDRAGRIVKNQSGKGYRLIYINGRLFGAHRLAWLYVHGVMPKGSLDHINCVRDDNRIENLRLCTHSQNMANKRKQTNNTSGYKGVCFHKKAKKWTANIKVRGRIQYLGLFSSAEAAYEKYIEAAKVSFGEFARF